MNIYKILEHHIYLLVILSLVLFMMKHPSILSLVFCLGRSSSLGPGHVDLGRSVDGSTEDGRFFFTSWLGHRRFSQSQSLLIIRSLKTTTEYIWWKTYGQNDEVWSSSPLGQQVSDVGWRFAGMTLLSKMALKTGTYTSCSNAGISRSL